MFLGRRIAFNLLTFVPGVGDFPLVQAKLRNRAVGASATNSARYCYSIWLRHLVLAGSRGLSTDARAVAELGPGASLGTGLAALLSGAEEYHGLDVVNHTKTERTGEIFEELVQLFAARAAIPSSEFPNAHPPLENYAFPHHVLTEERLARSLDPKRIERIRASLKYDSSDSPGMIHYHAPWTDDTVVKDGSVDIVFSQAVLEHVDDLRGAYAGMSRWLRPAGYLSHVIDFNSHGWSNRWDGHWAYSDLMWKLIRGKDMWSINRQPWSVHERLLADNGFKVMCELPARRSPTISRDHLAPHLRDMTEDDRNTSGVFFLATKI